MAWHTSLSSVGDVVVVGAAAAHRPGRMEGDGRTRFLRGGATFLGEGATVLVGDAEAWDFGDEASGDSWPHAPSRAAMQATDSTQAMRLHVNPRRRFVAARSSTSFMESSPAFNVPVSLISTFGVPTMREERAELEWLDRGICGVTKSRQPGVEPGQAAPQHPLVVPHQRTGRAGPSRSRRPVTCTSPWKSARVW
jgi:hypothetical protein